MSLLEIDKITKSFGNFKALDDVSFSVDRGEVVGFIGPNGAGKSTTIRTILGIIKADSGRVSINGMDAWNHRVLAHENLVYVPGDVSLWGNLTGGQIIDILIAKHESKSEQRKKDLIHMFQLDPTKKAKRYSKGNRQKIALIAALSVDVDLYIFDEPTSGLDPLMESLFQKEVLRLKSEGKAVLLSSHILSEVERLADRVVIIREGKIVDTGSMNTAQHLSKVHVLLETKKDGTVLDGTQGIENFSIHNDIMHFDVQSKNLNDVMLKITELEIIRLETHAASLEEVFMEYYDQDVNS